VQELDLVKEDSTVYKLIGPTLIKQDLVEAKANVSKRLGYISNELTRLAAQLRAPQEKLQRAQEQVCWKRA
jgi:prefoldin beta subunit